MEGTFKKTDDNAIRIEVEGRIVTFAPADVRAICSAPAPAAPAQLPERDKALGATRGWPMWARSWKIWQWRTSRAS